MLREELEIWPADLIPDAILFVLSIYVINLGYLEDGAPYIIELLDGDMRELDLGLGLNYNAIISVNNNQPLLHLSGL